MEWDWGFPPLGVFGFIVAIVFIASLFSFLKARSAHETIRQLAASGQPIDRSLLKSIEGDDQDNGLGLVVGGTVTLAVAVALVLFGQQIGVIAGDDEVGPVLRAVAVFPGLIGLALLGTGVAQLFMSRGKDGQA